MSSEDLLDLNRREEELKCECMVLKDILARARWFTGEEKQLSPPTADEMEEFLTEVRALLAAHGS